MRTPGKILLLIGAAALALGAAADAFAQKNFSRGPSAIDRAPNPSRGNDGPRGGERRPGWRVPGVIMTVPGMLPPGGPFIDDDDVISNNGSPRRQRSRKIPSRGTR